jgi:hypothetical protein
MVLSVKIFGSSPSLYEDVCHFISRYKFRFHSPLSISI